MFGVGNGSSFEMSRLKVPLGPLSNPNNYFEKNIVTQRTDQEYIATNGFDIPVLNLGAGKEASEEFLQDNFRGQLVVPTLGSKTSGNKQNLFKDGLSEIKIDNIIGADSGMLSPGEIKEALNELQKGPEESSPHESNKHKRLRTNDSRPVTLQALITNGEVNQDSIYYKNSMNKLCDSFENGEFKRTFINLMKNKKSNQNKFDKKGQCNKCPNYLKFKGIYEQFPLGNGSGEINWEILFDHYFPTEILERMNTRTLRRNMLLQLVCSSKVTSKSI